VRGMGYNLTSVYDGFTKDSIKEKIPIRKEIYGVDLFYTYSTLNLL
jgi:hypothetical protein